MTKRDILTTVCRDLGVIDPIDTLSDEDAGVAEDAFDRLLDNWNAERQAVYAMKKDTFTLTALLSPHTIGPTGATWTTTQRPVSIENANLIITGGAQNIRRPLWIRDQQWYAARGVPTIEMAYPTDLYYEQDWPNGKLYFYGVPSSALDVELWSRMLLSALTLDDDFDMPPGYRDAVVQTLTVMLGVTFKVPVDPRTVTLAGEARARAFNNNRPTPRLATRDAGMPRSSRGVRTFNIYDRTM